jgi:hypothetical protein
MLSGRGKFIHLVLERSGIGLGQLQKFMASPTWPVEAVHGRIKGRGVDTIAI